MTNTIDKGKELIEQAKHTNLVDYFSRGGFTLKKQGSEFYVKEISTLCINGENNSWYNHYTGKGGNNAINCLIENCQIDFKRAIEELTGESLDNYNKKYSEKNAVAPKPIFTPPVEKIPQEKTQKELVMPVQAEKMSAVFAYLTQTRKIPYEIVKELADKKLLYQSNSIFKGEKNGEPFEYKNANAVFVHKNENGETVGAEIQGTNSYKRFKGIAQGTGESAFIFVPVPDKNGKYKKAYLFESAVDMMSFYHYCDPKKIQGIAFVSLAGLKPNIAEKLKMQGVEILSCVDNDEAGRQFENENKIKRASNILERFNVKDWNELLQLGVTKNEIAERLKNKKIKVEPAEQINDETKITRSKK